ncbi:hypothetical protein F442_15573 [Phytophthora nicotianae P10297]|uniref:Uncharacterized protein n=1 Tax=Phytophthora nicotianae P10297 TaxID=1317064 RepID=W2YNK1_PHYNI|nr:hypothetical protein F442_15573 [Phytophthora nicotianae P10297]
MGAATYFVFASRCLTSSERDVFGWIVEQPTCSAPGVMVASRPDPCLPLSPSATLLMISSLGSTEKIVFVWAATSSTEAAGFAPSTTSRSMLARLVSKHSTSTPAFSKLCAIGKPILPRPMKPTALLEAAAPKHERISRYDRRTRGV